MKNTMQLNKHIQSKNFKILEKNAFKKVTSNRHFRNYPKFQTPSFGPPKQLDIPQKRTSPPSPRAAKLSLSKQSLNLETAPHENHRIGRYSRAARAAICGHNRVAIIAVICPNSRFKGRAKVRFTGYLRKLANNE